MASEKVSEMTPATSLDGTEIAPIVKSGANKSSTVALIRGWSALGDSGQVATVNGDETGIVFTTPESGIGGSTGATDNSLLRADGTGGETLQNSPLVISDNGDIDLGIDSVTPGTQRTIEAKGSVSNISIDIVPKGTSGVSITGPYTAILNVPGSSLGSEIRFFEAPTLGTKRIGLKAPDDVIDNITYELPEAPSSSGQILSSTTGGVMSWVTAGSGDVVGPSSSTDNALARYDLATGKLLQNSVVTIDDFGNSVIGNITTTGDKTISAVNSTSNAALTIQAEADITLSSNSGFAQIVASSSDGNRSIRVTSQTVTPATALSIEHSTSGTVGVGFATRLQILGEDAGDNGIASYLDWRITDATSTQAEMALDYYLPINGVPTLTHSFNNDGSIELGANGVSIYPLDVAGSDELAATNEDGVEMMLGHVSGTHSQVVAGTTVFTVTIGQTMGNTNYKVTTEALNSLSAPVRYVTNKTATTFDVTYLSGLTGTVEFDWILVP